MCENGFAGFHEMIDIGVTLDERIADGYYFSKSLRMFKQFLQNPEILDDHYIRRVIELNGLNELKQKYRSMGYALLG